MKFHPGNPPSLKPHGQFIPKKWVSLQSSELLMQRVTRIAVARLAATIAALESVATGAADDTHFTDAVVCSATRSTLRSSPSSVQSYC